MLKGIAPCLNADVLFALRAMGHGDVLALTDTNFPADRVARATTLGRVLRMENLSAAQAARAVLSVLPLDTFVEDFALRMEVGGAPDTCPPVQTELQAEIDRAEGQVRPMLAVDRYGFYDRAQAAYAVIQTGETRLYGCFLFRKGVIAPTDSASASAD